MAQKAMAQDTQQDIETGQRTELPVGQGQMATRNKINAALDAH